MRDRSPWLLLVLSLLLGLPFLPLMYWLGDEGLLCHGALRMLRGQVLYRDIFAFLPPGGYLLVAGWIAAIGPSLLSLRVFAQGVLAGIAALTYLTCREAGGSRLLALVPAGFMMLGVQGDWAVISHHWIVTLLALGALAALQRQRRQPAGALWPLLAGLLAGAATLAVQSRGGLIGLACGGALLLTAPRALLPYAVGAVAAPAATLLWLVQQGAARDAWMGIVGFTGAHYGRIQSLPFAAGVTPQTWPAAVLFPLVGVLVMLSLIARLRGRAAAGAPALELLCAAAAFVGCYPRPDIIHVLFNAPLAFPLACVFVGRLQRHARLWRAALVLGGVAVASLVPAYVAQVRALGAMTRLSSPRGPFITGSLTDPADLAGLLARLREVPRGEPFFFYPYLPMLAYLEGRPHVAALDIYTPSYTTPAQYRRTCQQIVAGAAWAVIDRRWVDPAFIKAVWPAMPDPSPPEVRAFHRALEHAFTLVESWGRYELRRRNSASEDCAIPER